MKNIGLLKRIFLSNLRTVVFISLCQQSALAASQGDHTDCTADKECVAITNLDQTCRHEDPTASEKCPVVNRKYAAEIESVDCYTNVGCRPVRNIQCFNGHCVAEES